MVRKPNQIIDEITEVVYPPAEAIESQLTTIRAIIPSTIKMYKDTGDIHTIQPNLDMIQRALDYLRGAPKLEFPQEPEDVLKPAFSYGSEGLTIVCTMEKENFYKVEIVGLNIEPNIKHPELFGSLDVNAVDLGIKFPIVCGKPYTVVQYNDMLQYFIDDPSIEDIGGEYIKTKTYTIEDDDEFEYMFLLGKGRNFIEILVEDDNGVYAHFDIITHIHFKQKENTDNDSQ